MAKSKSNIIGHGVSPVGIAEFCWLEKPQPPFDDGGQAKYNVTLAVNPDEPAVKEWVLGIKALTKLDKGWPWKIDEESGNLFVRFASYKPVTIVDSKRQPLSAGIFPGSGSELRIAYTVNEYKGFGGGINLYLNAVQVIKLVEQSTQVPFEETEGYVGGKTEDEPKEEKRKGEMPF